MNRLESRKQLLIAESELNREQVVDDLAAMTAGVHALTDRAKTFSSIASATALLAAGVAAFRRGRSPAAVTNPTWLHPLLKGAGLVSTLWLAFRARRRESKTQAPNTSKADL